MSNELSATINKLAHAREERRKLQDTVAALEFKARQLAIELYKANPENKQPHPAVTIKHRTVYDIDKDTALSYAIQAKSFLVVKVDETGYRNAFKASPGAVPGVTVIEDTHPIIKADLSEWKTDLSEWEIDGATVTPVAFVAGESPKPTLYSNTFVAEETAEEMVEITESDVMLKTESFVTGEKTEEPLITNASPTKPLATPGTTVAEEKAAQETPLPDDVKEAIKDAIDKNLDEIPF